MRPTARSEHNVHEGEQAQQRWEASFSENAASLAPMHCKGPVSPVKGMKQLSRQDPAYSTCTGLSSRRCAATISDPVAVPASC